MNSNSDESATTASVNKTNISRVPDMQFPESIWNMADDNEYLYFTGISPVYLDETISDKILLKDASESAAVYDSVFGVSGKISAKSSIGTRTGASFNYIYNNSSYNYYLDNLEAVVSYKDKDSVYRVFRVKRSLNLPDIKISTKGTPPIWLNQLPEIDGYSFSIGFSGRYSKISDSVKKADASSLEEMIKQKNITVFTDSGYNGNYSSGFEYSKTELKGFYILRRWWSPDYKYFYSLGMIKENQE